jgi:hypothetical protein
MSQVAQLLIDQLQAAAMGDLGARYELLANGYCPFCGEPAIRFSWPSVGLSSQLQIRCGNCLWSMAGDSTLYDPRSDLSGQTTYGSVISQATLLEYVDLQLGAKRKQALREMILARLAQGGRIEPGVVGVELRGQTAQNPSWAEIIRILGSAAAAELRRQIPPRTIRQLWLVPGQPDF